MMKRNNKLRAYEFFNFNLTPITLSLLLFLLLSISCNRKNNFVGMWEIYTLIYQDENILNDPFFESIYVPVLEFENKKVKLRVELDYYFTCDYKIKGDSIIFKNCDKPFFDSTYFIELKQIYDTKSRSLYYMVLESENGLFELEKTTIKL